MYSLALLEFEFQGCLYLYVLTLYIVCCLFSLFLFYLGCNFVYPTVIESLSLNTSYTFLENQAQRLFYLIRAL